MATLAAILLVAATGLWLGACSSAMPVLTFFFDDVPKAGAETATAPPARPPRRQPYKPPRPDFILVDAPVLAPVIDWRARFDALPRNDEGEVEWVRALNEKTISPKPALGAEAKDYKTVDDELEYIPKTKPKFKVLFKHLPHTQWLRCDNCHNSIFKREQGKAEMTMAKLEAGEYCGVCHVNVASPNMENCAPCHPK